VFLSSVPVFLAPGNHDYDYGEDNLRALISSAAFPVVNCNIYDRNTGRRPEYLKPWVLLNHRGVKIALTGILDPKAAKSLGKKLYTFEIRDETEELLKILPEIEKAGPDVIVVLAHMGVYRECKHESPEHCSRGRYVDSAGNLALAHKLKGKPVVILGGHIHGSIPHGYRDPKSGIWVGESGAMLETFTRAELRFDDKTGKYLGAKLRLRDINPSVAGQQPQLLAAVSALSEQASPGLDLVLGTSPVTLDMEVASEPSLAEWIADVYRERFKTDFGFMHRTGLRMPLYAGPLTPRDIYNCLPYDNTVLVMKLKGSGILEALRDNYNYRGKFHLRFSGLKAHYLLTPKGELSSIRASIGGKPLDPEKYYTAALSSYLISGVQWGKAFQNAQKTKDTGVNARQPLIDALRTSGRLRPPDDGPRNTEEKT
ncbi:MAG TPA: 5'-nucleotidase C-terminal domain-containing protein, partial [Elusimicrobiales bacterium]|nr:5'-nucleotidase C-terminal domain-containing protein [Elusimicrobiales bacterium]